MASGVALSPSSRSTTSKASKTSSRTDQTPFEKLLRPRRSRSLTESDKAVQAIRRHILTEGLTVKEGSIAVVPGRHIAWKLLLQVPHNLKSSLYTCLVAKGPSLCYQKIRNDSFRTLTSDETFKKRVGEDRLVRLLEAWVWRRADLFDSSEDTTHYVQGMNVLGAPFLAVMPSDLEAYHCYCRFLEARCPLYIESTMIGVHQAVMTFSAATPPLEQVLHLWDFYFAYGCHMNIICIIAQLMLMRTELMHSSSPGNLLRNMPPLHAREVITLACGVLPSLDDRTHDQLVRHPFDSALIID